MAYTFIRRKTMPGIGDSAPYFTGNDFINSGTFTLSDYLGEVIVLAFVMST
jgi:peroxiredoxin